VVPHRSRDLDRRRRLTEAIEIGTDHPADSTYLVAQNAPLLVERGFAGAGIPGRIEVFDGEQEGD
jgi:hypothetical protein